MTCSHDPDHPWSYRNHKRRGEEPCAESRKAWRDWLRSYRYRTGRVRNRLTPVTKETQQ